MDKKQCIFGFPGLQKQNGFDRKCVIIKGSLIWNPKTNGFVVCTTYGTLHKKWNFPLRISSVDPKETADLVTFTEEILNAKLNFLCSGSNVLRSPFKRISNADIKVKKLANWIIKNLRKCSFLCILHLFINIAVMIYLSRFV